MEKFKGTVIHSVEYRRPQPLFVKKRVLVVGLGTSTWSHHIRKDESPVMSGEFYY